MYLFALTNEMDPSRCPPDVCKAMHSETRRHDGSGTPKVLAPDRNASNLTTTNSRQSTSLLIREEAELQCPAKS